MTKSLTGESPCECSKGEFELPSLEMVHLFTPASLESRQVPCCPPAPRAGEGREGREQPPAQPLLCTSPPAALPDLLICYQFISGASPGQN